MKNQDDHTFSIKYKDKLKNCKLSTYIHPHDRSMNHWDEDLSKGSSKSYKNYRT